MNKHLGWLLLAASVFLCAVRADAYQGIMPNAETVTAKMGPIDVCLGDLLIKEKKDYTYLLWDLFPYRQVMQKVGAGSIDLIVKDLIRGPLLSKFPKSKKIKIDLVEYTERDNYGAPAWDKVNIIGRYEAKVVKKKITLKKTQGKSVVK